MSYFAAVPRSPAAVKPQPDTVMRSGWGGSLRRASAQITPSAFRATLLIRAIPPNIA